MLIIVMFLRQNAHHQAVRFIFYSMPKSSWCKNVKYFNEVFSCLAKMGWFGYFTLHRVHCLLKYIYKFCRLAREKAELDRIHGMTEEERKQYLRMNPKVITNMVSDFYLHSSISIGFVNLLNFNKCFMFVLIIRFLQNNCIINIKYRISFSILLLMWMFLLPILGNWLYEKISFKQLLLSLLIHIFIFIWMQISAKEREV